MNKIPTFTEFLNGKGLSWPEVGDMPGTWEPKLTCCFKAIGEYLDAYGPSSLPPLWVMDEDGQVKPAWHPTIIAEDAPYFGHDD